MISIILWTVLVIGVAGLVVFALLMLGLSRLKNDNEDYKP